MKKILLILLLTSSFLTLADDNEISLLDASGEAVVYIVLDDEFVIYTWDGDAVAYLEGSVSDFDSMKTMDVYGWNGDHLGWFFDGVVMNHHGDASCSIRERHPSPGEWEYIKYMKYVQYLKYIQYTAPKKPVFSGKFGEIDCLSLMISGGP